jgi:hypothetical protein
MTLLISSNEWETYIEIMRKKRDTNISSFIIQNIIGQINIMNF